MTAKRSWWDKFVHAMEHRHTTTVGSFVLKEEKRYNEGEVSKLTEKNQDPDYTDEDAVKQLEEAGADQPVSHVDDEDVVAVAEKADDTEDPQTLHEVLAAIDVLKQERFATDDEDKQEELGKKIEALREKL